MATFELDRRCRGEDHHERTSSMCFIQYALQGVTYRDGQFTPTSLANAALVDPKIKLQHVKDLTFTLSASGGVGAWTWLDHPAGTVGHFMDTHTNIPSNGFYLVPGNDRTGTYFRAASFFQFTH